MQVGIIDYGMGNLASVRNALKEQGYNADILTSPDRLLSAPRLILPGVGSFKAAMHNLESQGWIAPLKLAINEKSIPLLGICLGMQLLADRGEENGNTPGLGFIPGHVEKLRTANLRIPHVGWNEIDRVKETPLLEGIPSKTDFYFVHSYHFVCENAAHILATTPYGEDFTSVIGRENIAGAQFHPEKSAKAGFRLLKNFMEVAPC